jgi:hypothetical protein
MSDAATLQARLSRFRAARPRPPRAPGPRAGGPRRGQALAERLAAAVDGEVMGGNAGFVVRVEPPALRIPLARERLAFLPGLPPADARLVCLDTETTGLGTAAGTLAFLVGLGWWEGDTFRRLLLVCPDHGEEPALLAALEMAIPGDAWLVTYNGRGFDWPLLVTRFRLHRRPAPAHAGMLDLLPGVRRLFRHRLGDARLATVERELLGVRRHGDVAGFEIPGRYLDFVRGGAADPLAPVLDHNAEDVASLARLLAHLDTRYADPARRSAAPAGDLVALARTYTRERRHLDALGCLDDAAAAWRSRATNPGSRPSVSPLTVPRAWPPASPRPVPGPVASPSPSTVSHELIHAERARTLRRLGRMDEALAAWEALAANGGPAAPRAWVEAAKLREHSLRDPVGALGAAEAAARAADRARLRWGDEAEFDDALAARLRRLRRRSAARLPGALPQERLVNLRKGRDTRQPAGGDVGGCDGSREPEGGRQVGHAAGESGRDPGGEQGGQERVAGARRVDPVSRGHGREAAHPGAVGTHRERDPAPGAPGQGAQRPGMQEPQEPAQIDGRIEVLRAHRHQVGPPQEGAWPGRARAHGSAPLELA